MSRTIRTKSSRWFRRPKTQSERRQVDAAIEEGVHVRPARNTRHIPTAWEDIPVSASYENDHRSAGTILAEEARARCNNHTPEQRKAAMERAMKIIYGHVEAT